MRVEELQGPAKNPDLILLNTGTLSVLKASFLVLAGISEYATTPGKASDYMYPLLSFAAEHIPKAKHQETPLYILCTAGMRVLPERYLHSISFHT